MSGESLSTVDVRSESEAFRKKSIENKGITIVEHKVVEDDGSTSVREEYFNEFGQKVDKDKNLDPSERIMPGGY